MPISEVFKFLQIHFKSSVNARAREWLGQSKTERSQLIV